MVVGFRSFWFCRRILTSSIGQEKKEFTKPDTDPARNIEVKVGYLLDDDDSELNVRSAVP